MAYRRKIKNLSLEHTETIMDKVMAGANQMASKLMKSGWIDDVTPMADGSGYILNVKREEQTVVYVRDNNEDIRISSEKASNGHSYWTMSKRVVKPASMHAAVESRSVAQPDWITDSNGNKLADTGNNLMIRINESTLTWDISTDGVTWINTIYPVEEEPSFRLDSENNNVFELTKKDGSTTQVTCER